MVISKRRRFIFVHVYKNAGSSISNVLRPFAMTRPERLLKGVGLLPKPQWMSWGTHLSAHEIRRKVGDETWDSCFKFAVVRNPWDWQTSLYEYMLKYKKHHQHDLVKSMGSFDAYIAWRCENEVRLQKNYVCDDEGAVIVDHLVRFESLQEEWELITKKIGISRPLPHTNASKPRDYRAYYNDTSIGLVANAFRSDIEMFGYRFE